MNGKSGLGTALTASALIILMASNLAELWRNATEMDVAVTNQNKLLADGTKVETQLDGLAQGVHRLASEGNSNAQAIIATLKANGVNINIAAKP